MTAHLTASITATIELLGRPYQIKCKEDELSALQKAAEYLNDLAKPLAAGRPISTEKLSIMLALNLASQIIEREQHLHQRLYDLQDKLEHILTLQETTPPFRLEVESAQG